MRRIAIVLLALVGCAFRQTPAEQCAAVGMVPDTVTFSNESAIGYASNNKGGSANGFAVDRGRTVTCKRPATGDVVERSSEPAGTSDTVSTLRANDEVEDWACYSDPGNGACFRGLDICVSRLAAAVAKGNQSSEDTCVPTHRVACVSYRVIAKGLRPQSCFTRKVACNTYRDYLIAQHAAEVDGITECRSVE